jgi:hypothetical protein
MAVEQVGSHIEVGKEPALLENITDPAALRRQVDATQFNNVMTLSPTAVLTVRYGFNRFPNVYNAVSSGFNPAMVRAHRRSGSDSQTEGLGCSLRSGLTSVRSLNGKIETT